jgi:regulator of nucleoside diphosphate kinase
MTKKKKNSSRKHQEMQKRQSDIISVAENVFQEEGFSAAKTEQIAKEAKVSVGTIYNIFGSKEKLFAQVLESIGNELIEQVDIIDKKYGPAKALEKIIFLRLSQYRRQSLFLMQFTTGCAYNNFNLNTALDKQRAIYYQYVGQIAKIIEKGINNGSFEPVNSFATAIGFEGLLNSFVNYWYDSQKTDNKNSELNEIKKNMFDVLRLRGENKDFSKKEDKKVVPEREVFITKYDYLRIKELIDVAQMFDPDTLKDSFQRLNAALDSSKIVNSEEVPDEVITMNSKIKYTDMENGKTSIIQLVFPADVSKSENALSILTPLGTELLGEWKGNSIEVEHEGQLKKYKIDDILYQPESAGDFYL